METLKTSFNQVRTIIAIAEKLENSAYDSTVLKSLDVEVVKFDNYLIYDVREIYAFSVLFLLSYIEGYVTLDNIINYIGLDRTQVESLKKDIDSLVDKQLIDKLSTYKENNNKFDNLITYSVRPLVLETIMNNNVKLKKDISKPMNIFNFTNIVDDMINYFESGVINYQVLVNTLIRMEKISHSQNSIYSSLVKNFRPLDRLILYRLFYTHIFFQTGTALEWGFSKLINATENPCQEIELLKNEEHDLIDSQYITVFESDLFGGVLYLQLSSHILIRFMEDEIKHMKSIDSFVTFNSSIYNPN